MPDHIEYICDFLNRGYVEGPRQTTGYIPCWIVGTNHEKSANFMGRSDQNPQRYEAMGVSGVTIATGVDLGQTDEDSLLGYGVSRDLIKKLSPYIGLTKNKAIRKLSLLPLEITESEAAELDHCVHKGYLDRYVRPAYDKSSLVKFSDLPKQAQAVIFSICYQKGVSGTRSGAPKTWYFLTNQMWADASNELINHFKKYSKRRAVEGRLLKELCK